MRNDVNANVLNWPLILKKVEEENVAVVGGHVAHCHLADQFNLAAISYSFKFN